MVIRKTILPDVVDFPCLRQTRLTISRLFSACVTPEAGKGPGKVAAEDKYSTSGRSATIINSFAVMSVNNMSWRVMNRASAAFACSW